uniref:Uncharacterized protein n=1 Tax=Rhizophora mucronata TaxID=61149 RepID=A0A2P2R2H4_RHIMU
MKALRYFITKYEHFKLYFLSFFLS